MIDDYYDDLDVEDSPFYPYDYDQSLDEEEPFDYDKYDIQVAMGD